MMMMMMLLSQGAGLQPARTQSLHSVKVDKELSFSFTCLTSYVLPQGAGPVSGDSNNESGAEKKPRRTRVRRRKPPPKVVEDNQSESDEAVSLPAVYPPHLHR